MRDLDNNELVYGVGLLAAFALRLRARIRYRRTAVTDDRRDAVEVVVLLLGFLGMLAIPITHLLTDVFRFAHYRQPQFVGVLGMVAFVAALALLWRTHVDLGRNWSESLELRASHQLITTAIYYYVRHTSVYAAIWLCGVAQAMLLHTSSGLLLR